MKGICRGPSLQQPADVLCPLSMSLEFAACAIAARAKGYGGLADIIAEQKLAPGAIASMLRRCSAAKDGMSLAVIVLAASCIRP